jgi:AraC-like DNA-binding protein
LSEIALKCGFNDQAHLCKQFRQHTGTTPAAWRRAHVLPFEVTMRV